MKFSLPKTSSNTHRTRWTFSSPIWTKIESRFSQEANTQPEIPCMQRWAEQFEAVNNFQPRIEGLIANWYHQGFYPTPVTELFSWLAYTNPPPVDELLRAMARRDFLATMSLAVGAMAFTPFESDAKESVTQPTRPKQGATIRAVFLYPPSKTFYDPEHDGTRLNRLSERIPRQTQTSTVSQPLNYGRRSPGDRTFGCQVGH
jgi:hypothetical protein